MTRNDRSCHAVISSSERFYTRISKEGLLSKDMTDSPSTPVPCRVPGLRVRIAVLTYRRPGDIAAVLPLLRDQAVSGGDEHTEIDIVVVDNDPAGSARPLVTNFAAEHHGVAVHYENETTPGISAARNRALATAVDRDVLVFIDDDERPTPAWLTSLLATYREHRSAAVVGPVISEFEGEPDRWVRAGRLFSRPRLATGTQVDVAATNNLLLDLHQIRALGLSFDPRFGLSGGADTMFTRELHREGGAMTWSDDAVVIDVVPRQRSTMRWVMLSRTARRLYLERSRPRARRVEEGPHKASADSQWSGTAADRGWTLPWSLRNVDAVRLPPSAWPSDCCARVGNAPRRLGLRIPGVQATSPLNADSVGEGLWLASSPVPAVPAGSDPTAALSI